MDKKILVNRIQCDWCGDVITSYTVHDFKFCKCGKVFVDGGTDYLHRSLNSYPSTYTELDIFSTDSFDKIRENFQRGGRGKDGKSELTYVALKDMSNSWIEATIEYIEKLYKSPNRFVENIYKKELEYRKEHSIFIKDSE